LLTFQKLGHCIHNITSRHKSIPKKTQKMNIKESTMKIFLHFWRFYELFIHVQSGLNVVQNKHRNNSRIHKANLTLLITIPHSLPETPVSTISSLQQPDLLLSSPAHGSSSQNKSTYSSHLSASQSSVIVSISQIQFLFFHCHWTHFCYNLLINSTTHQTN
jgi:hypothetical protein